MQSALLIKSSILQFRGRAVGKRVKVWDREGSLRVYDSEFSSLPLSRQATVINRYLPKHDLVPNGDLLVTHEEIKQGYQVTDVSDSVGGARYLDSLLLFTGSFQGSGGTTWGLSFPPEQIVPIVDEVAVIIESLIIGRDVKQSKEKREEFLSQTDMQVTFLFKDHMALDRFVEAIRGTVGVPHRFTSVMEDVRLETLGGRGVSIRVSGAWLWQVAELLGLVVVLPAHAFAFEFEQVVEGKPERLGGNVLSMTGNRSYWSADQEGLYTVERAKAIEQRLKYLALRREQGYLTVTGLRGRLSGVPYRWDELTVFSLPRRL